jgi:hypothetical protein
MHFCRTEEMIADFFTKPLHGALLLKYLRDHRSVLGIKEEPNTRKKKSDVKILQDSKNCDFSKSET